MCGRRQNNNSMYAGRRGKGMYVGGRRRRARGIGDFFKKVISHPITQKLGKAVPCVYKAFTEGKGRRRRHRRR